MSLDEHDDDAPIPKRGALVLGTGSEVNQAARRRAVAAERYRLDVIAGTAPPVEVWPRHRADCKGFKACAAALSGSKTWRCPPPAPYFAGCPDLDVDAPAGAEELARPASLAW